MSKEEKKKISRDETNPYGYHDTEHTKNVRDWKEVFDFTVQNPTIIPASHDPNDERLRELINQWPEDLPELREDRLNEFFKDQTSRIRLNYYPPCPVPHLTLGVGRHKDAGVLTILAQDNVGGLEVKRKSDGDWVFVKPVPDAYIINVGDMIQVACFLV